MKYIYPSIAVLIISVGFSLVLFSQVKKNQETEQANNKHEDTSVPLEEDIKAIYSLLAVQSSHVRTIMNMNISRSHWQTHKGRTPQIECEECLRIYGEIRQQVKKIEEETWEDAHNKPLIERVGATPKEPKEKGEEDANEPRGSN